MMGNGIRIALIISHGVRAQYYSDIGGKGQRQNPKYPDDNTYISKNDDDDELI
jgi:hypothetical protein